MSNGESAPAPEARRPAPAPARNASYSDRLFRAITLVAVLGSAAVIWWSLAMVLFPRLKQSRELISTVSRLSTEVDDLEHQWTTAGAEQVSNQLSQADSELFEGRAGLEAWLANFKGQVAPLALDVRADLGLAIPQTAGGRALNVIPVTVSVEVKPTPPELAIRSPYQRILRLSQRLTGEGKRADLMELMVAGGTNSIGRTVLVLNCWTEELRAP
jgi:hypothetical protein